MSNGDTPSLFDGEREAPDSRLVAEVSAAVVASVSDALRIQLADDVATSMTTQITRRVSELVDERLREQVSAINGLRATIEEVGENLARQQRQAAAAEQELRATVDRAVDRAAASSRGEGGTEFAALRLRLDDAIHRLEIPPPDLTPIHDVLQEIHAIVRDDGTVREEFVRLRESVHDIVVRSAPDLAPLNDRLTDIAATVESRRQRDDAHHEAVLESLGSLSTSVGEIRFDPTSTIAAVDRLRDQLVQTLPDVTTITGALRANRDELLAQLSGIAGQLDELRAGAGRDSTDALAAEHAAASAAVAERFVELRDVVTAEIHAQQTHLDEIRLAVAGHHTDLQPVLDAIAQSARVTSQTTSEQGDATVTRLQGVMDSHLRSVALAIESNTLEIGSVGAVLEMIENAVTQLRVDVDPTDAIATLSQRLGEHTPLQVADVTRAVDPILTATSVLTEQLRTVTARLAIIERSTSATDNLASLESAIANLNADVLRIATETQTEADGRRDALSQITAIMSNQRGVLTSLRSAIERLPDQLTPPTIDLRPALEALAEIDSRLPDQARIDSGQSRLSERINGLAADVQTAIERVEAVQNSASDGLLTRLTAIERAIDSVGETDSISDAETRLTQRVEANFATLRTKLDDQFLMTDSVGANMSQLNATLVKASEEPHQLRRDLDRTLDQLAEHLGAAMREMRTELHRAADDPIALRSSVEAGLDRISGRFQSDAGRILEAVTLAQEDADGRLRRIDTQVSELRRSVEQVRRQAASLPPARPSRPAPWNVEPAAEVQDESHPVEAGEPDE